MSKIACFQTINKINSRYNAEYDLDPNGPPVPWHVAELTQTVSELLNYIIQLEDRVSVLEGDLNTLRQRFDAHEFYGEK